MAVQTNNSNKLLYTEALMIKGFICRDYYERLFPWMYNELIPFHGANTKVAVFVCPFPRQLSAYVIVLVQHL